MRRFNCPLLVMLVLFAAFAAQAQPSRDQKPTAQDKGNSQDRDQALPASVRRVERETGGEVISAEPVQRNGREVYHLKVLTPNGRVRMVQEDPQDQRRDSGSGNRQDRGRQNRSKDRDQRNNQEPEPRNGGPDKDDNPDSQP